MLRDKAVDILMGRLGNRTNTSLRQTIIDEMVFAQETILEGALEFPWFLISELATETTVAEEERFAVPVDFLAEWEDGGLYVQETDGTETLLIRDSWDILKSQALLEAAGKPKYYDIAGEYYLLRPTPDDTYTIKQRYYQRALSLAGVYGDAANIENKWLKYASDWLIAETGVVVAGQRLQSEKMVQMFAGQATMARKRVQHKTIAMQESNKINLTGRIR